jgi:hypothetical protein
MAEENTVEVSFNIGPGTGFWAGHLLDSLVAPEMSKVSVCAAPDIPEPPSYFGSYFLNNVFIAPIPEDVRPLVIVFLRRWTFAVREYRAGRDHLSRFAGDLPRTNNQIGLFLSALGHFEHCIINAYLALMAVRALIQVRNGQDPDAYKKGDGSTADLLHRLYSAIKHYESGYAKGHTYPAPIWITDKGLKCRYRKEGGFPEDVELTFEELAAELNGMTENARLISEGMHRSPPSAPSQAP